MKRRQVEHTERRRPMVEMNLLGEVKARSGTRSRGCASLLGRLMGGAALLLLLWPGLS
jgi:hypothetical protein